MDNVVKTRFFWRWVSFYLFLVPGWEATWAVEMNAKVHDVLGTLAQISAVPRLVTCDPCGLEVPVGGHLQGIQKTTILGKPFIVISGSSNTESYLALVELDGDAGCVIAIEPLRQRPFKHAGGIQVCGDYLAVGIEDDKTRNVSTVWILKVSELLQTTRAKPTIEIERRGAYERATAGAVALAQVQGRHLLCVGTWDSATIDIYRSNGKSLDDSTCVFEFVETWAATQADRSSTLR